MCKKSSRPDLLSDLPLGIIHIILSFIPLRDAARTGCLSRKWRYIWSSLPHLAFDNSSVNPPIKDESEANRLICFISQILLLHEGPIHEFQLYLTSLVQSHSIDSWIRFLSRNHIRILSFKFDGFRQYVHSSLYSCQYLTHLELSFCDVAPPLSTFKGFLRLRSLRLCTAGLFSRTVESILAHCPVLEELTLDNLSLQYKTMSLSIGAESFRRSSVFPHLRIMKLSNVPFDDQDLTASIIRLITGSPNLHKLEILGSPTWNGEATLLDTESVPNITYDGLKVIKMEGFCGVMNEMKLIKLLLARSPVLEKMVYKPHQSLSDLELLKLTGQMVRYRRASANVAVAILDDRV